MLNTRSSDAWPHWVKPLGIGLAATAISTLANPLLAMPAYTVIHSFVVTAPQATFSVDAHILSAGALGESEGVCFRMGSTIADTVAGHSQSLHYRLESGFMALQSAVPRDDIFTDNFEGCSP